MHKIKILTSIFCLLTTVVSAQQNQPWKSGWPGCNGLDGSIPKSCYNDFLTSGEALTPETSTTLRAGYYPLNGEMVWYSDQELQDGYCAARMRKLGQQVSPNECDTSAEDNEPGNYQEGDFPPCNVGCLDSIPRFAGFSNGFVSFVVCDSSYTYLTPCIVIDTTEVRLCAGEELIWRGQMISDEGEGIYEDFTEISDGCDTLHILVFFEEEIKETSLFETISPGDTIPFGPDSILVYSPGIYKDTIAVQNGCDSILVLEVVMENQQESQQDVCVECYEQWRNLRGLYAYVLYGKLYGVSFGSAEEIFDRFSYAFGFGYEWRLRKDQGFFKNRPCVGESINIQIGLNKQNSLFVPIDCDCNNVPDLAHFTSSLSGEYRFDLLREWPMTFGVGLKGKISYNKVFSPNPEIQNELSRFSGNFYITPHLSRYFKLKDAGSIRARISTEIPLLRNSESQFGFQGGAIVTF